WGDDRDARDSHSRSNAAASGRRPLAPGRRAGARADRSTWRSGHHPRCGFHRHSCRTAHRIAVAGRTKAGGSGGPDVSPIAISADKRFHRAHVKPSRKRSRLRAVSVPLVKGGLITAFVLLLIYRGGAVLAEAPILKINRIIVNGNHRLATEEVLTALGGMRGENIVLTDLGAWRERLVESPWVRDATFRRSLPSTVEVVVAEREPMGIGRLKGQLFLVDEHGTVI